MPAKPLSAEYFDEWYADKAATPTVAEITNRHLGLPADLSAGVVPGAAIPELLAGLRLSPGDTLLDLACGRAGYGLMIAQATGATLIGVDFSAQALAGAREQAARLGVAGAAFHVGELTASGLPDAAADAVLCTDSIQFPDHPADAYREIRRVLKPGGRVVLTCWEPVPPATSACRPGCAGPTWPRAWRPRASPPSRSPTGPPGAAVERALWEEAAAIDPGEDPALRAFRDEAARSLDQFDLIRRVMAVATAS